MSQQEYVAIDESDDDTTSCTSDQDSEHEDPSFDLLEETRSRFSNLSVKRKSASRSRLVKKKDESADEGDTEEIDSAEVIVPELDARDQKSFEIVQKTIDVGQVDKLKVEQCKVYLRKHGLRLTGNKDTLLHRIKEHLSILNGDAEKKYPASSFVMNCKGDACTGDNVMFEQNVYEMFNLASRSGGGPPCGTRVVVGRIVKESYGAAKQQHTFTIEVLWSEGVKPLPPLHPLLIKGRNLYRLKTMRQRWEDEGERQKILFEKHTRGSIARSTREARIQEKDIRKKLKENRVPRMKDQNRQLDENKINASQAPAPAPALNLRIPQRQPTEQQVRQKTDQAPIFQQFPPLKENNQDPPEAIHRVPTFFPGRVDYRENGRCSPSMGLLIMPVDSQRNFNPSRIPFREAPQDEKSMNDSKSSFGGHIGKQHINVNTRISPLIMSSQAQQRTNITYTGYQLKGHPSPPQSQLPRQNHNDNLTTSYRSQGRGHEEEQPCRYYPQGRCYYGDRCKYLH